MEDKENTPTLQPIAKKDKSFTENWYFCEHCDYTTRHLVEVQRHEYKVHIENQLYKYPRPNCDTQIPNATNAKIAGHYRRAHLNKPDLPKMTKCPKCPAMFRYETVLNKHLAVIHCDYSKIKSLYVCLNCGYKYLDQKSLELHLDRINCDDPTIQAQIIDYETAGIAETSKFPCDLCTLNFASFTELIRHKTVHNDIRKDGYKCGFCNQKKQTPKSLMEHERTVHTFVKSYYCGFCPMRAKTAETLEQHYKHHL